MKCSKCGAELDRRANGFCVSCGNTEDSDDAPEPSSLGRGVGSGKDVGCNAQNLPVATEPVEPNAIEADQNVTGPGSSPSSAQVVTERESFLGGQGSTLPASEQLAESPNSEPVQPSVPLFVPDTTIHSCPLRIEINLGRFFMQEAEGVIDLRLRSLSAGEVTIEAVALECTRGEVENPTTDWITLPPEGERRLHRSVRFQGFGQQVVRLCIGFECEGRLEAWVGEFSLDVLHKDPTPQQISVHIDQRVQAAEGAKQGFGLSVRNQIDQGMFESLARTPNDLLRGVNLENWSVIDLYPDSVQTHNLSCRYQPPVRPVSIMSGGQVLVEHLALCMDSTPSSSRALLLGGSVTRCGRNKDNTDIRLYVLPRSEVNDPLTTRITGSQPHFTLQLGDQGLTLLDGSSLGTWVNRRRVQRCVVLGADNGATEIELAGTGPDAAMRLRLSLLTENRDVATLLNRRLQGLRPNDGLWQLAGDVGLRALRLDRISNLADEESYWSVYRWVTLGRGHDVDIQVPGMRSLGPAARLIRIRRQFWIESLDEDLEVWLNDERLPRFCAAPIAADVCIRLAEGELFAREFIQLGFGPLPGSTA